MTRRWCGVLVALLLIGIGGPGRTGAQGTPIVPEWVASGWGSSGYYASPDGTWSLRFDPATLLGVRNPSTTQSNIQLMPPGGEAIVGIAPQRALGEYSYLDSAECFLTAQAGLQSIGQPGSRFEFVLVGAGDSPNSAESEAFSWWTYRWTYLYPDRPSDPEGTQYSLLACWLIQPGSSLLRFSATLGHDEQAFNERAPQALALLAGVKVDANGGL